MRLTLRLQDDNYLDVDVNIEKRELTLISPVPNITAEQLCKLADQTHYTINLLITEERIRPDSNKPDFDEIDEYYKYDTETALTLLLGFCNCIISEF